MNLPYIINYNFYINDEIKKLAFLDIVNLLEKNEWYKPNENIHGVTTSAELFEKNSYHWKVIKESFINSVFQCFCLEKNIDFSVIGWSYINVPNLPSVLNWHGHGDNRKNKEKNVSGVMYLNLPLDSEGYKCSTTEFLLNDHSTVTCPPIEGHWILFKSRQLHRPGLWMFQKMKNYRVVLAADFFIENEY